MTDGPISLSLTGFPDFPLIEPIDWLANPYGSGLWQHHLLSLRWLRPWLKGNPPTCGEVAQRVLRDFVAYHSDSSKPQSPYFAEKPADHTMAERLLFFADVCACVDLAPTLREGIAGLTAAHFETLVGHDVYRPRTNHGLMVDKAMLVASYAIPSADPDRRYAEVALRRAEDQVNWLFTASGATREHSISYQEYNLNICLELRDALLTTGTAPALVQKLETLLRSGQELLAYAVCIDGRLMPLGDTFRDSNSRIIAALRKRGLLEPHLAHVLSGGAEGSALPHTVFIHPEGGFAFVRDTANSERAVHLGLTAAWHSDVHKQLDDLSFVLSDGAQELVVDAGYSDRRAETDLARLSRSEMAHNVVVCRERPWQRHLDTGLPSPTRLTAYHAGPEVVAISGQHQRIARTLVRRTLALLPVGALLVLDQIEAELPGVLSQLFHLAPGLVAREHAGGYQVQDAGGALRARFTSIVPASSELVATTTPGGPVCARWRDRSETEPTSCLVYSTASDGNAPACFAQLIEFGAALKDEPTFRVWIDELVWGPEELSFRIRRDAQAERVRVRFEPLSHEPVRWP